MAGRHIGQAILVAAIELTAGVDAAPTGAANAVLVNNLTITPIEATWADRNPVRGFFGATQKVMTTQSVKLDFECEMAGSGTAGTPPEIGRLFLACSMAEAVLAAPARVEYTPVTTGNKTITFHYFDAGVLHKVVGSVGSFTLDAKTGEFAKCKFSFRGQVGGESLANTVADLAKWKMPIPITKATTQDVTLGCSYAAGLLTGGTTYPSTGLSINLGNEVNFTPNNSVEISDVGGRKASGSVSFELSAAQEVDMYAVVRGNTLQGLGMAIGNAVGQKIIIFGPAVQLTEPKKEEVNKRRYMGYNLNIVPLTGNDELRIVFL